eukprot:TRINITY_DN12293_c0_g1_i1.p1 TRINITY_DN12293_c0_g1~~TRINITY_DN12293_c0_g1_i1.p1  ORF type:complete len:409 (-),score=53.57 TRINITY_DN12293_c0_g1_i1:159-1385(-)
MTMEVWSTLVSSIESHYDKYHGFVVIHGTDTMSYTASALSFMLENLKKPVILTGSQVPLYYYPTDALENLMGSIVLAAYYDIPEVCLYFSNKLMRGNRTTKIDALGFNAFASHNFPALIKIGTDIDVRWLSIRKSPSLPFVAHTKMNLKVGVIKLFPGITAEIFRNFLLEPLQGCVLETYGAGNAPNNQQSILDVIKQAVDRGVIIVNCTQCATGNTMGDYATGHALTKLGVISGSDMTTEAAVTKLSFLLARDLSIEEVKKLIPENIRGELTPNYIKPKGIKRYTRFGDWMPQISMSQMEHYNNALEIVDNLSVWMCHAASKGSVLDLKKLIKMGGDVNSGDYDKRTALHLAASEGFLEAVKFLLSHGANPAAKDRWGHIPLDDAVNFGHQEIAQVLSKSMELINQQ